MNSISQATYCVLNGALVLAAEAMISVQDRGFRYGDGVFESIAVENGVPYQYDWHMARLSGGLDAIKIAFDVNGLQAHVHALLQKNKVMQGMLRIQITRGAGSRGYLPDPSARPNFIIETMPKPPLPEKPVSLWRSSYQKMSAEALPVRYKLCQGLNSTLARMEAAENNCFDALLLNAQSEIGETGSGHIFWQKNGAIFTPALTCGILEGSTRAAIMRLLPVTETSATMETLAQADAVCIANAAWGALAVNVLQPENHHWQSEHFAVQLNTIIREDKKYFHAAHHSEWQMPLE